MTSLWLTLAAAALVSAGMKAAGPALLGGGELPPRIRAVVALVAPALLASLIAVQTFGSGDRLVLDARAAGVTAAGVALALRVPALVAVAAAAAVTAVARALW